MERVRRRVFRASLIATIVASTLGTAPAHAAPAVADPDLSTQTDASGTGGVVGSVRTELLRAAVPDAPRGPRILVLGTGIQRSLFPAAVQAQIDAPGTNGVDTHGWGTVAASAIFQLLPKATVTSVKVRALDGMYDLLDTAALATALDWARANRSSFDIVLMALPPQGVLDPVSHLIGHVGYGSFGRGMQMVAEAMVSNRSPTDGPIAGIPANEELRRKLFAGANLKQRDAIERYARQALAWRRVVTAVRALAGSGVPLVVPAGDYTRKSGGAIVPLPSQTSFGLASLPDVITVGAAFGDGGLERVSPISGRGPTLGLGPKPDLLAASDVMTMLPGEARVPWKDDSLRVPLQPLKWAAPDVLPTPCPSPTNVYRCTLQGSTVVAAAVASANLASLVAGGTPHAPSARASNDDEVLRGIAWSAASKRQARAFGSERGAYAWEQGAGVLIGLGDLDLARTPVALAPVDLGEVAWDRSASKTVPLWPGAAGATSAGATISSFLGVDRSGAAVEVPFSDGGRVGAAAASGTSATVTAAAGRYQGGLYTGGLTLTTATGDVTRLPLTLVQALPVEFHADYAYNELQTGGSEGERVERATAVLFAGLPTNVGLIGEAFKNLQSSAFRNVGGDPTNGVVLRYGTTKDSFTDSGVTASRHGHGRIEAVPPGFYRIHLLTDHAIEAVQERGRRESLGMQLASSGPDAAVAPGSSFLVPSTPPCSSGVTAKGPLSPSCTERDTGAADIYFDRETGFCVVRNTTTKVAFNLYCGEIAYAVPSAMVSRAMHHIEHDSDASRSEWRMCGVDLPLDGKTIDLDKVAEKARSCGGTTAPTSWKFDTGSTSCLGPAERGKWPSGAPTDVSANYYGAGPASLPGRNLPVGVLTYEFKLPYLNTYTMAGAAFSYRTSNAIVAVRFQTGADWTGDASTGLVVVDDPDVTVTPALKGADAKGSVYQEWAMMSSNQKVGLLSLIVIPTVWARSDLDGTKPIATVDLCDVAMRVSTYSKVGWGKAAVEGGVPTQHFPMLDRDLLSQIDPSASRVRAHWDPADRRFEDAGTETESVHFAVQIPKASTMSSGAAHHVLSPRGGPAYLKAARRWGTDSKRYENVLSGGFPTYDPRYGITPLDCSEAGLSSPDPALRASAQLCRSYHEARASGDLLADLVPEMSVNGRFAGVLPVDRAAIAKGAGNVAFEAADADDGGAFDSAGHWVRKDGSFVRRFPVGNFFDDTLSQLSLSLLSGVISVGKDSSGLPVLSLQTGDVGGSGHLVTTDLE